MSGIPYEMKPQGGLAVQGGQSGCFRLGFPSRSVISKIVVTQTGGSNVNFKAALYNHENACEGLSASDSGTPGDAGVAAESGPLPPDVYRVTPDLSGVEGKLLYFSDQAPGGHGFVFCSQDKLAQTPQARLGQPRTLYLKITAEGSGPKEFAVALAGEVYE